MRVFTIEPCDGWRKGDKAYCIRGTRSTKPTLETGKVYRVSDVIPLKNMQGCGIVLSGIETPSDTRGFWSSRFVKIPERAGALRQIDRCTTPIWHDAYDANNSDRSRE